MVTRDLSSLPVGASDEEVARYTRSFVLDIFGFMVFADMSGGSVPVMYLRFLHNPDDPSVYNWGAAVLAYLYRNLSSVCLTHRKSVYGPLLLLQY